MLKWRADREASHEDLFVSRYEQLFGRALQLTGRARERAEDLVHEAFVQFVLGRPDLDTIHNLDAYLYGMLRNLHLSQVRRGARGPVAWLSAVDYDSADVALRHGDIASRLQIQDQLVALLRFACARKRTSKSGSVLLLRFFHGYYPDEIAKLLAGPARAVDDWLRLARREARHALDARPGGAEDLRVDLPAISVQSPDDFVAALRSAIFTAPDGVCDAAAVAEQYRRRPTASVPTALLAHIVSCHLCLERANAMLGLGSLGDRYPTDSLGPGGRTPPLSGGGAAAHRAGRAANRRLRDVLDHRPKQLRIFANGFLVGSQTISSAEIEQTLTANIAEPIGFVEVFSEQGIRLALLSVNPPPDGDVEQRVSIELDHHRSLDVRASFDESWPNIRTVYRDPSVTPSPAIESSEEVAVHARQPWFYWWRMLATCTAAFLVAAILYFSRGSIPTAPTGDVLLARAAMIETAADAAAPIVHRTVLIEEGGDGRARAPRQRLEIWRDTAASRAVRRLFDANGVLIAAEWTSPDGGAVVFARDATPRVRRLDPDAVRRVSADDVWRAASAVDVAAWLRPVRGSTVADESDAYVVAFNDVDRFGPPWLAAARLRIRKGDSHLVEGVLTVRRAAAFVEYRIVEAGFRRVERSQAPANVFAVDPNLEPVSDATPSAAPSNIPLSMTPFAAIRLQLTAVEALHGAGACLGEQLAVTRTPAGIVRIEGVVDDGDRRREVLQALSALENEPGLVVRIASARSAVRRTRNAPSAERQIEVGPGQIAAHAQLSRYFASASPAGSPVDESIRTFAAQAIETSRRVLLNAWALKRLTGEFRTDALRAIGTEAYGRWAALIADHARDARNDLDTLRRRIAPVVNRPAEDLAAPALDATEIEAAADRLLALSTKLDADVRAALTVSDDHGVQSVLASDAFWDALARALAVAEALRHAS